MHELQLHPVQACLIHVIYSEIIGYKENALKKVFDCCTCISCSVSCMKRLYKNAALKLKEVHSVRLWLTLLKSGKRLNIG